ncbi:hypothetical protein BXY85_4068 [Roseivirga pacifica]|uniref:Outer membrane protein beta-barrel domain-containing protein n=1 Tax=Roseivirga pacifica TaxID=1267423 RepID=A0A1I0PXK5_9BACT|nr:hypothetical protein [Roseivirga pacifica]RKQ43446.1 hypothetical protein BXY85_4068 [Roseivirga pacifica]SEW19195.1 hypothetical protein SAMN05216290_1807 [Roseivirga pacifica]
MKNTFLKRFNRYGSLITLVLITVFSQVSYAQSIKGISLTMKTGPFDDINQGLGLTAGIQMSANTERTVYSVDYLGLSEIAINRDPAEKYKQVALMIGRFKDTGKIRFTYQGGVGIIQGNDRTDVISKHFDPNGDSWYDSFKYESEDFTSISFSGSFSIHYMPTKWFSIGGDLQTSISSRKILYMPMLSVSFGMIRE